MSDESKKPNPDLNRVEAAVNTLIEHYDSVQIFANRHEETEGGTIRVAFGKGSWYARYGQIREWVIKSEEDSRIACRKNDDE